MWKVFNQKEKMIKLSRVLQDCKHNCNHNRSAASFISIANPLDNIIKGSEGVAACAGVMQNEGQRNIFAAG